MLMLRNGRLEVGHDGPNQMNLHHAIVRQHRRRRCSPSKTISSAAGRGLPPEPMPMHRYVQQLPAAAAPAGATIGSADLLSWPELNDQIEPAKLLMN